MKCVKCGYDEQKSGFSKKFPILKFKFKSGKKKEMFERLKKFIKVEYVDITEPVSNVKLYGCTRIK